MYKANMTQSPPQLKVSYDIAKLRAKAVKMGYCGYSLARAAKVDPSTGRKIFCGLQVSGTSIRKMVAVVDGVTVADLVTEGPADG